MPEDPDLFEPSPDLIPLPILATPLSSKFFANIPPAKVPSPPAVFAPLPILNISLINFSAGIKNPIATIPYKILFFTKSIADDTKATYNIKCTGCNIKCVTYSLNHALNACALLSPILSSGYVNATNGAIIVKNAIYKNLLKYINVNLHV